MQRAIRWAWTATWLLAGLLAAGAASAQRVEGDRAAAQGVYEAEVPVNNQGESERKAGLARALAQVLGKLSGEGNAAMRPGVGQELRRAEEYVENYDYRQDEGVSAIGAPTYRTILIARFDPAKVDDMAASLGVPVWPTPRPKPVLWLAIDDGSGPRLVSVPQADAARSTLNRAIERGYRLGLPSGTAAEQAAVGAIWRGDTGAIARLSSRYSPPMQLIGKLRRAPDKSGWAVDWSFVDGGKVLLQKTVDGGDARRVLASGADVAADALSRKYARQNAVGPAGTYRVAFTGVDNADDFIRLSAYLQQLPVVRKITPVHARPGAIEYDLELVTGIAGFRRMADEDVLIGGGGEPVSGEGQPVDGEGQPVGGEGQTATFLLR